MWFWGYLWTGIGQCYVTKCLKKCIWSSIGFVIQNMTKIFWRCWMLIVLFIWLSATFGTKCTCFQEDKVSAILICCGISTANAASVALLLRLRNLLPQTSLFLQLQLTFGKWLWNICSFFHCLVFQLSVYRAYISPATAESSRQMTTV